ncbi:hypothetical protein [Ornithinimicrobium panacihumi]|uniref:hypothetical protein n=1 Tax=Ornithinimicrobium panacihumi TaxID=2008449 RepID=UPI003F8CD394
MRSRTRVQAWALVALVLVSWLVALVLSPGRAASPASVDEQAQQALLAGPDAPVVVVGVPGLTWDVIDPSSTPTLDAIAHNGATAALVLRGQHEVTCAADAWLTLGAGQRAGTDLIGCGEEPEGVVAPDLVSEDGLIQPGRWEVWRERAAARPMAPQLGSLAATLEGAGCVAAYGPDAAIAAADGEGRVAAYRAEGLVPQAEPRRIDPDLDVPPLDGSCRLHLISTPPVLEGDRSGQLPQIDAGLAQLRDQLPRGSRIVVAGMGHTAGRAEAMALMVATASDAGAHTLTSTSTQQTELVQLTDLTVALHQILGQDWDEDVLAGGELRLLAPGQDPVGDAESLAAAVSWAKKLAPWVLGALFAVLLPALGGTLAARAWAWVAGLATIAMAVPAATFLAGLVPWWRTGQPWPMLTLVVLLAAMLIAGIAWAGPWRKHRIGPPAVVAAVTMAVLGVDVLTSSRMGLVSVLGLQPVTAGRFYGQGNVGFGIMLGAFLVVAAALVAALTAREREGRGVEAALAVGVLGLSAVAVNAAPQAGADFGGVPALVIATGLMVLAALQVRWSWRSMALLGLAGVVVAGAVMVADWLRGPGSRTHLGDFVQAILDGEALGIVGRKLGQSLGILVNYPATWAAVLALAAFGLVVVARPRWSARLWQLPGVHAAALAGLITMAITWAMNDSGIAAVGLTLTMLVTAAIALMARRRLGESAQQDARHA